MKTLLQFIAIGITAIVVGVTGNELRGNSALVVSKNYFDTGSSLIPTTHAPHDDAPRNNDTEQTQPADDRPSASAAAADTNTADTNTEKPASHLDHPYQTIEYADIVTMLADPLTGAGLNVVVDARNESHFEEGHLPGAMLCNPYQVASYIDADIDGQTMLDRLLGAEKIVVYCGGGDCADSVFMCRELLELDVPYDAIFLYEGGWKDWTANGGSVEEGMD